MTNLIQKLKGVNFGGWLVLEKWITPSLFEGTPALDDFQLNTFYTDEKIQNHYKTFITEDDFIFLSKVGINALRIPVGYWIFGDEPPFQKSIDHLDYAFELAKKYNIQVLIDLHGAPGSQNGWDHSGFSGKTEWHRDEKNISQSINVISRLAQRYAEYKDLWGIELLNEPHQSIPIKILKNYYKEGYKAVREYCSNDVAVVISDSFRPNAWNDFMTQPEFKNVILDLHLYQCFTEKERKMNIIQHLHKTNNEWNELLKKVQENRSAICGEWSLALDPQSFYSLNDSEIMEATRLYGQAQLKVFEQLRGWFYWTYKTEDTGGWNFKSNFEQGQLLVDYKRENDF